MNYMTTCALSGTEIKDGQNIICQMVIRPPYGDNALNQFFLNSKYIPFGFTFEGVYCPECGGGPVDIVSSPFVSRVESILNEDMSDFIFAMISDRANYTPKNALEQYLYDQELGLMIFDAQVYKDIMVLGEDERYYETCKKTITKYFSTDYPRSGLSFPPIPVSVLEAVDDTPLIDLLGGSKFGYYIGSPAMKAAYPDSQLVSGYTYDFLNTIPTLDYFPHLAEYNCNLDDLFLFGLSDDPIWQVDWLARAKQKFMLFVLLKPYTPNQLTNISNHYVTYTAALSVLKNAILNK
jgi:hypothetical protein